MECGQATRTHPPEIELLMRALKCQFLAEIPHFLMFRDDKQFAVACKIREIPRGRQVQAPLDVERGRQEVPALLGKNDMTEPRSKTSTRVTWVQQLQHQFHSQRRPVGEFHFSTKVFQLRDDLPANLGRLQHQEGHNDSMQL